MDFSFQNRREDSPSKKPDPVMMLTPTPTTEEGQPPSAPPEEYDPSQPLDSSDEDEPLAGSSLTFEKDDPILLPEPSIEIEPPEPLSPPVKNIPTTISSKPLEIDLSSIPMPSDEYRRPAIQFSIPTRHRLMSISSLIKRQKGVMKKQDRGGISYNSEISKAFLKSDSGGEGLSSEEGLGEDGRPKISLVQEIFGSDDEDGKEEEEGEEDGEEPPSSLELGDDHPCSQAMMISTACDDDDLELNTDNPVVPEEDEDESNKMWKTVSETSQDGAIDLLIKNLNSCPETSTPITGTPPHDPDASSGNEGVEEEIQISIKPSSELLEDPASEGGDSSEIEVIETHRNGSGGEDKRGKENKQTILECVSDEEPEFEVTFVAMGKSNLTRPRGKPFRIERRVMEKVPLPRKKSLSPLNGFEEGEIIDHLDRKKKKGKKKKSKKRKRSKDSRVSTKINSERSPAESVEKKSYSPNSDGKEVSWRKPSKLTKSRNYRNGKQDSEEKYPGAPKHDDSSRRKGRSPIRYAAQGRSRRNRSISNGRFRSRSRSGSKDSIPRWENRYRGAKRTNRGGSHRSHSSLSNHSSHSHSRSRSLNRKRGKRRHSPSPLRKRRNDRSISRSRVSKSPRPQKRNKSNGTESSRRERIKERSPPHRSKSPADTHSNKKNVKTKTDDVPVEDSKKKPRKERTNSDEVDKEKRKKRKRREKSLSPVKAIVADGDSIVVSLSFQKAKEEVSRTPKLIPLTRYESSGEREKGSFTPEEEESDDSAKAVDSKIDKIVHKKGTITINLDLSPGHMQDLRQSPDIVVLHDEPADHSSKSHELKNGQEPKLDLKNSSTGASQRTEGVDFVSSSHDSSAENVQQISSTPSDPKTTATPERAASASKSPYKFSDYFVSSTCDVGKISSPAIEAPSPKHLNSSKLSDSVDNLMNQKASDRSPFTSSEMSSQGNSTETGADKPTTPAQDTLHTHSTKSFMAQFSSKPMIGNIPGLFPSGFSTGAAGGISAAPIVIPAPPRIIPNTHSPNLLNPNVLVSVASALYAPLLAAKQNQNTSGPSGQTMMNVRHNLPGNMYSKNMGMQNQTLNLGQYNRATNNGTGASGAGGDSPFSPNSSDGDDLFEPPGDGKGQDSGSMNKKSSGSDQLHLPNSSSANNRSPAFGKYPAESSGQEKRHLFNTLFSTNPKKSAYQKHGKKKPSHLKKSKPRKAKRSEADKNGDQEMTTRLSEEVPTSAVALKMKEKFLKKLNRQERVVEEVKLSLKPHYSKKHVSKDEYKEILRRAVPKICHNKSGEINPNKIKELVEAYVKKFRIARKTDSKAI